jgi:Spherulation-specific family 4
MTRLEHGHDHGHAHDTIDPAAPPLVMPAYFHPAAYPEQWALLAERASEVHVVILNLANGPGTQRDPSHLPALRRLQAARVTVSGYVDTDYGRRPLDDAVADIERFREWYQVGGVCFDRAAVDAEHLDYYAELAHRTRSLGAAHVTFNHGAHPQKEYAEHADLLGTFEGPWTAYLEASIPRWTRSVPAEKFYHVVYSVPRRHFGDAYLLATSRGAGYACVTDHGGSNPYERLPADWLESLALR